MEEGFAHLTGLIDQLANLCAREFTAIHDHFKKVDDRLDTIEGRMEAFSQRLDYEVEERHKLTERVAKVEQAL